MVLGIRSTTPFEKRLGHRFHDASLLQEALTHRSFAEGRESGRNYERLEFLGDAVLGLVATEWLFEKYPSLPEGKLAKLKGYLVSTPVLGRHAIALGLGESLRMGIGEERSGGRTKLSLLADSMEAVIGATYLDGGLKAAQKLIWVLLEVASADGAAQFGEAKTDLQEWAQGRGWELPVYKLAAESGPDHRKVFTVECWLQGELRGQGEGESKKIAEQRAAAAALQNLAENSAAAAGAASTAAPIESAVP
jgi:ribonuclease III